MFLVSDLGKDNLDVGGDKKDRDNKPKMLRNSRLDSVFIFWSVKM